MLAGLRGDRGVRGVRGVCPKHDVSETLYYQWRDELLAGGREVLRWARERAKDARGQGLKDAKGRIAQLERALWSSRSTSPHPRPLMGCPRSRLAPAEHGQLRAGASCPCSHRCHVLVRALTCSAPRHGLPPKPLHTQTTFGTDRTPTPPGACRPALRPASPASRPGSADVGAYATSSSGSVRCSIRTRPRVA